MLAASRASTTRPHHGNPPHPASRTRTRSKHSHRDVVSREASHHVPRGTARPASTPHRRVSPMDTVTKALTNRVNSATLTTRQNRDALVINLIQDIHRLQKELSKHYSCDTVMLAILEGRLDEWQKRTIGSLKKTLSRADVRQLQASLRENFQNAIAAMEANQSHLVTKTVQPHAVKEVNPPPPTESINPSPTATEASPPRDVSEPGKKKSSSAAPRRTHSPRKKRRSHVSKKHRKPRFYLEQQEGAQCGRHAINAFYQKAMLPNRHRFHNMFVDCIYKQMQEIEKLKGKNRPLICMEHALIERETDSNGNELFYTRPTPMFFDDMPVKRMVLSVASHHVCFFKHNEDWYLLDSQNRGAVKMTPSAYINARRRHYSAQQLEELGRKLKESRTCRHCQKSDRNSCKRHVEAHNASPDMVTVICWEKGQNYEGDRCFGRDGVDAIQPKRKEYLSEQDLRQLQKRELV